MSEEKQLSSDFLKSIEGGKELKDVKAPAENIAGNIDMAMYGVSHFDKDKLKKTETVEKNVLPTAEDIKAEKEADGK